MAIKSIAEQTYVPDELLIIQDGPVGGAIETVIRHWELAYPGQFRTHTIETNQGLGNALRVGVAESSHEMIARMDSDDIAVSDRIERQRTFLQSNPEIDIVGGYLVEFADDPESPYAVRQVPESHEAIERLARFRSPMNHATVLFRRSAVIEAGNYRAVDHMEDYDLWVRMLQANKRFANIPEVLLKMRAGTAMYSRRRGLSYLRREIEQQVDWYEQGFINSPRLCLNLCMRVGIRCVPSVLQKRVYGRYRQDVPV
ncbi:glycosyltransferase [Halocatena halophila]|uniref:glycosyltransferase n=1 Tax=Halocatena halophila TaxID=2814576 RepID=UPI002ED6B8B4